MNLYEEMWKPLLPLLAVDFERRVHIMSVNR